LILGYFEHCLDSQAGPLGMDLGFDNKQADGGCPSLHQPGTSSPSS
jgi:hypothetical protein